MIPIPRPKNNIKLDSVQCRFLFTGNNGTYPVSFQEMFRNTGTVNKKKFQRNKYANVTYSRKCLEIHFPGNITTKKNLIELIPDSWF